MRKYCLLSLPLILLSTLSLCQEYKEISTYTKDYYLVKRSQNNTTGHILFWTGFSAMIAGYEIDQSKNYDKIGLFGFTIRGDNKYNHTGAAIAFSGLVLAAGSVPFFYFAVKNKKKANSLRLKNETFSILLNQGFVSRTIPSLNLKINL